MQRFEYIEMVEDRFAVRCRDGDEPWEFDTIGFLDRGECGFYKFRTVMNVNHMQLREVLRKMSELNNNCVVDKTEE